MSEHTSRSGTEPLDYRDTLFLPKTDFPMRAGLPQKEPEILARWREIGLYERLREDARGRTKYLLHDGPPYANGNLHIGHALNKILKDVVTRSLQMLGYDSNYVPGWDCHGLPIEWKIEEQYRAKGLDKDAVPINEFRRQCREFAQEWVKIQSAEFQRLGVIGDWADPYLTMSFGAEAQIARELMKFAATGQLYRGSKPVMWSVVEKTALAEAEVEYQDYQSDMIWVKFPVQSGHGLDAASIVIWTTTPWTIPGNRAISFSSKIAYGLYEVTAAAEGNWAKVGDRLILADQLADSVFKQAKVEAYERRGDVAASLLKQLAAEHPLRSLGYSFWVPLLDGEHVTDDAGTGFVHTAPGHGTDDFEIWTSSEQSLRARGIDPAIPFTVDADGFLTKDAPGFEGRRVITDKGDKGDANESVIKALQAAGMLIARGRLKHQYPHSWRSKKPVIYRNTPQWFIAMDRDIDAAGDTLRHRALDAIEATRFVPQSGQNRLRGMIENRPDWVISRQRAWGVPIAVFIHKESAEVLRDETVNQRIAEAFEAEGADAWFAEGAKARFLGNDFTADEWEQVTDILDVWFDSGSTHAFVLEQRPDLQPKRAFAGGEDRVIYLEGTDQHRGWFHSSLLESCGTRGHAPYDEVVTHGFVMDEEGRKMSKSLGNITAPQDVIKQNGADILRLWVMSSDYEDDLKIGPEIVKANADAYRKLRNTVRYLLGGLAGFEASERVAVADMPELERYMLHKLWELDGQVREGYGTFDYRRIFSRLFNFCTIELSSVYFDIRKDALYCDPLSSIRRRACRTVMDQLFSCLTAWLAPMLAFTMEEAWLARFPSTDGSVHLRVFPEVPGDWRDDALNDKWEKIRQVRRVVTGALEIERAAKAIGSSLEAAPIVYLSDPGLLGAMEGIDLAEISITSDATLKEGDGPDDAYRLPDVVGVAVVPARAEGRKCARSWKISPDVGSDPDYPDITPRDAEAVREWRALQMSAASV
ncbi:isoleucyl-tRNA synthetase [Rhodoligotrophos appendicifer]|uniref:isoleucine--tRNA ligase n=1 Tax=Rhodoligotrophos appendicifer TaxID=987056 RepID=UPI001186A829|nr:isoleucine--tRNA ligase [Rhodoligotrophos appendicifer]